MANEAEAGFCGRQRVGRSGPRIHMTVRLRERAQAHMGDSDAGELRPGVRSKVNEEVSGQGTSQLRELGLSRSKRNVGGLAQPPGTAPPPDCAAQRLSLASGTQLRRATHQPHGLNSR